MRINTECGARLGDFVLSLGRNVVLLRRREHSPCTSARCPPRGANSECLRALLPTSSVTVWRIVRKENYRKSRQTDTIELREMISASMLTIANKEVNTNWIDRWTYSIMLSSVTNFAKMTTFILDLAHPLGDLLYYFSKLYDKYVHSTQVFRQLCKDYLRASLFTCVSLL